MPRTRSRVYRNWLGLMNGTLVDDASRRAARPSPRRLHTDRVYDAPGGGTLTLPGRSLMLVRNVGHHMYTDAVLDADGKRDPGGHPRRRRHLADRAARPARRRARCATAAPGSVYIVKPKMHGPEEVAFAVRPVRPRRGPARPAAQHAEDGHHGRGAAHLAPTSPPASTPRATRVVFINTGFLDRTGDEIHTSMEAGADDPQGRDEDAPPGSRPTRTRTSISAWPAACAAGRRSARACGRRPTGWPTCWRRRSRHPQAGANTAWVPSPTAATLHALHYHQVDVAARQAELAGARARAARRTC